MINPRKDNLRLCSSNDLYKWLFLTQPENTLFLNDSVSLNFLFLSSCLSPICLLFLSPVSLPSCFPPSVSVLPSLFLSFPLFPPFFLPSSFFLSLFCAVCVCVCCVCDCQRANTVSGSQSRWDSVFIAMPTCSKRRVHAQKRLSGGHGLGQPPNKWMETRKVFWKQND